MNKLFYITVALVLSILSASANDFTVNLGTKPVVIITLDREYSILEADQRPAKDLRVYMFTPKDEQSSGLLSLGRDGFPKTEQKVKKRYGSIVKVKGSINSKSMEWWHYKDSKHLYSTGMVAIPDQSGKEHFVYIDLVANTQERLSALEAAFKNIDLKN